MYKDRFDKRLNKIQTKKDGVYGRERELEAKFESGIAHLNEVVDTAVAKASDKDKAKGKIAKNKFKNLQNKEVAQHRQLTGLNKNLENNEARLHMINQNSTNHTMVTDYLRRQQARLDQHDRQ